MNNIINNIGNRVNPNNPPVPEKSLGQQDFLRLMVAQVQHQDPLQPNANGDFIAQMAQFSTSDGVAKMQQSIEQLAYSFQSNQALQASSLVGRKALIESDQLNLQAEGDAKIAVDLPAPVSDLTADIYGEAGELITKIPLGQHQVGQFDFNWNGLDQSGKRVPAGKYRIEVIGNYQGQSVALRTMTRANIESVSLGHLGDVRLNVEGIGAVSLNAVRQISQ